VRSIAAAASGRPAPRYGAVGAVVVTTARARTCTCGMRYAPVAIIEVANGVNAPVCG
jgi:hypothetical protein